MLRESSSQEMMGGTHTIGCTHFDKYTDGKLKEIGSNFIGSIYSCNNQIYLINSMVRYYDEANDSFGALTSCPEWLMTIKDNKLKKLL